MTGEARRPPRFIGEKRSSSSCPSREQFIPTQCICFEGVTHSDCSGTTPRCDPAARQCTKAECAQGTDAEFLSYGNYVYDTCNTTTALCVKATLPQGLHAPLLVVDLSLQCSDPCPVPSRFQRTAKLTASLPPRLPHKQPPQRWSPSPALASQLACIICASSPKQEGSSCHRLYPCGQCHQHKHIDI